MQSSDESPRNNGEMVNSPESPVPELAAAVRAELASVVREAGDHLCRTMRSSMFQSLLRQGYHPHLL
jgi:hypothetical protein